MPIHINNTPTNLTEEDSRFIELVNNRITTYGQIPYTVPQPLIIDMIKEGARFFYKNYWKSGVEVWAVLEKKELTRYLTTNGVIGGDRKPILSFHVKLPPSVKYVREIYERGNSNINWDLTLGFSSSGSLNTSTTVSSQYSSRMSGSNQLFGINNDLYIQESVVKLTENNVYESCCTTMVAFTFDPLTKDLFVHRELKKDFVLKYCKNVELQYLYLDDLFIKYIIAKCEKELKRLLAGHTFQLPGGVEVSADEICSHIEDIDSVEEQVKASAGLGDVILYRS